MINIYRKLADFFEYKLISPYWASYFDYKKYSAIDKRYGPSMLAETFEERTGTRIVPFWKISGKTVKFKKIS